MSSAKAFAPDPRRADHVFKYEKEEIDPDELPPDYWALLSLLLGIASISFFKYKILAWLAVVACLGSIANIRFADLDLKQIITSVSFAGLALVMNYSIAQQPSPQPSSP